MKAESELARAARLFCNCAILTILAMVKAAAIAQTVPGCGQLENAFGPFDYRDPENKRQHLAIVERHHFTPEVESLKRGSSGTVLGDLNYTLRVFPNHHRALRAIARYGLAGGLFPADAIIPSVDCYFLRAITFTADDEIVRAIYADYLYKRGDREAAKAQYEYSLSLAPESADINYVAGLFYLQIGDIPRASELAEVAYKKGYPLPGLRKRLESARSARSQATSRSP